MHCIEIMLATSPLLYVLYILWPLVLQTLSLSVAWLEACGGTRGMTCCRWYRGAGDHYERQVQPCSPRKCRSGNLIDTRRAPFLTVRLKPILYTPHSLRVQCACVSGATPSTFCECRASELPGSAAGGCHRHTSSFIDGVRSVLSYSVMYWCMCRLDAGRWYCVVNKASPFVAVHFRGSCWCLLRCSACC